MRKLAFSLVLFLACAFGAQADVLYWMIDTDTFAETEFKDWSYATLTANSNEESVQLGWELNNSNKQYFKSDFDYGDVASSFNLATPQNYTYLVELWNESGTKVAAANPYSYDTIATMLKSNNMTADMVTPLVGGDFSAVPEPTSGLLFLMGGVLLGLRRRRMA